MKHHIDTPTPSSGGIGFGTALLLIFIVLKLIGTIDWSWVWVLSPLWISFAIGVIALLIYVTAMFISFRKAYAKKTSNKSVR